jgi:serine/threonine protein kinase
LHKNKVIHCDLKCANLLIDRNGKLKLSDFGCSQTFDGTVSNIHGQIKGSLAWMAPEVIISKQGYGRKADIWSLGCCVIEMAVAGNPYGEDAFSANMFESIIKISNGTLAPKMPKDFSKECLDFIGACLNRNPNNRPSALELLDHPFISSGTTS